MQVAIKAKIPLVARPNTSVLSRDYKRLYVGIWPVRGDEDKKGYVQADEMTRETSVPGVYAAGDLTTGAQAAILSAAAGMRAAAMLNHALTMEMVSAGALV